jgi:sugar PTS system EIIA component
MFGFFKKGDKKDNLPVEKEHLYSPANGIVVPVSDVADPVFSQKMMGDGFAVIPADGNIYSPAKGKVLSVFPTKHAVGILLDSGLELLLHMGLDTVELNGKPFEVFVKEGQALTADTLIAKVDLAQLQAAGKDSAMVVVITNMDKVKSFSLDVTGETTVKTEIGSVLPKE